MNMSLIQNQKRSNSINMNTSPLFRSDSFGYYSHEQHNYTLMEKRQLFLRSYQFIRKKSFSERIKGSFVRLRKVVIRSARKFRRLEFSMFKIKCGFYYRRYHNKFQKSQFSSCLC
ncbi:hypothetical protein MtrunA17_Chr7g0271171 [Medicago truncatula]|uniref:Uncharacterized protein n=1 Tax=Medicago truncatula TaxID=3880 RepID=Q2HUZ3_MEDTR|nr:hypothetical protein MtrDRAFT_AC149038g29v2 [Medicago truncatula]AES82332.1 hypothetical protein MTR_7g111180 [Medicago truncatula]RHN49128.1 hypothetical protein MtrunA17_Chr7g0271171 [Medicago truncatula]